MPVIEALKVQLMQPVCNNLIEIKPFSKHHLGDFVSAVRESEKTVGRWMDWWKPRYSEKNAIAWFETCQKNINSNIAYHVGIFKKEDTKLLGGISINKIDNEHKISNIGYWVRETFQQRGIATTSVNLIKEFGFNQLGLVRLEIIALENNLPSRKVAEKCGFELECIARNRLLHFGKPMSAAVYSIIPQ